MKLVQILGPGCPKCEKLAWNAEEAVSRFALSARVEKVTDIAEIITFGPIMLPALVIDGEVKSVGRILAPEEVRQLLLE